MEFLNTQQCWKVVKITYNWQRTLPEVNAQRKINKLLCDKDWSMSNSLAKLYIKEGIKQEDNLSIQLFVNMGAIWKFLMEKYEKKSVVEISMAIKKLIQ